MADIKAKDISVAQSVGASDLILGSSIAGTTANVKVETVGKYIIDQLSLPSLNNSTVANRISQLLGKISISSIETRYQAQSLDWEYTGLSITVPNNHIYLVQGQTGWSSAEPIGLGICKSISAEKRFAAVTKENSSFYTPLCLLASGETGYLMEKRVYVPNNSNIEKITYIDINMT